jgi:WD40 repeat protein
MKQLSLLLFSLLYISCSFSMETTPTSVSLKLTFADDSTATVDKRILEQSSVLKNMIEDLQDQPDSSIPLYNIPSQFWAKTLQPALEKIADSNTTIDEKEPIPSKLHQFITGKIAGLNINETITWYISLLNSADYLDIPELLTYSIPSFAQYLKINAQNFLQTPKLLKQLEELAPNMQKEITALLPVVAISDSISIASSEGARSVAFNPGGTILASGSLDNTIKLWDIQNPKNPHPLTTTDQFNNGHTLGVASVAFNPRETIIASGSWVGIIDLWDIQDPINPHLLATIFHSNSDDLVTSVAFNPGGTILASGSLYSTIDLWNIQNPQNPHLLATIHDSNSGLAFNPRGTILASGSLDNTIKLWDIQNPQNPQLLTTIDESNKGHSGPVKSVAFNPQGTILASGSWDTTIKLWDIQNPQNPQLLATIHHSNSGTVTSIAFNPGGTILASGSLDNTIKLWDIQNSKKPELLTKLEEYQNGSLSQIAFNPQGTVLASGSSHSTIKLLIINDFRNLTLTQSMFLYSVRKNFNDTNSTFKVPNSLFLEQLIATFPTAEASYLNTFIAFPKVTHEESFDPMDQLD